MLDAAYDYSRTEIAHALESILQTAEFEIEGAEEARQAQSTGCGAPEASGVLTW